MSDLAAPGAVVHCPRCGAEYGAGVSICPDDGALVEAGPSIEFKTSGDFETSDAAEPVRGRIEVVRRAPNDETEGVEETPGLFEREEHPRRVVLVVMASEDAPDLVAGLEVQGIGARLGNPTPEDGVEVLVHDSNLAGAQAILVEFTGDPSLVDDMDEGGDDEAVVSTAGIGDLGPQAERLRAVGIDVRLDVPQDPKEPGKLWVQRDDLDEARRALGIVV